MACMAAWQRKLTTKVRVIVKAVSVMGYACVEVQTQNCVSVLGVLMALRKCTGG